jgi:hypothetical protein
MNKLQHQPAQLGLDGSRGFTNRITESYGYVVVPFRQRDREIKRLVARAKIAAQSVFASAINTCDLSALLESITEFF